MSFGTRRPAVAFALALTLGVGAGAGAAQTPGTIVGKVVDAGTGDVVQGALVELQLPERAAATLSNEAGAWVLDAPAPGSYRLRVTHLGYGPREETIQVPLRLDALVIRLTPAAVPLEAIVVTGSRRPQRLADTPVLTEMIGSRVIENAASADLSQLLLEQLGIQMEGGPASGEGLMLQGLGSQRVLIMVDGQPLVGRVGGTLDISRIPVSVVERVEVVKGPQSALYGSEAMGGVVNIVTKQIPERPMQGSLGFTAGTQGRLEGTGSVGGSLGPGGYLASLAHRGSELTPGRSETLGALAERWDALVKLDAPVGGAASLHGSALMVDELQRWQSGQLFNFAESRQWAAQVGGAVEGAGGTWTPTLSLSEFDRLYRRATSPDPVDGTGERELQRLVEAELLYGGSIGRAEISAGVEGKRETIVSDRVAGGNRTYHSAEPFGQLTLDFGRLRLAPGARFSWSEQWGTHFTPSAAAMVRVIPDVTVRLGVGRGYRAPDFKELGMDFLNLGAGTGYVIRGNPDLRPESSTNVSAGIEWNRPTLFLSLRGFENRFDDFIETRLAGDSSGITRYVYQNVADGYTRGFELEGAWTYSGLRLEAGYSFLDTENRETGVPLLGRARHSGRATYEQYAPAGIRLILSAVYTGSTVVGMTDEGDVVRPGFLRLDSRLSRSLGRDLGLSFGMRNVLDSVPPEWAGFGGRHTYIGIEWKPGWD